MSEQKLTDRTNGQMLQQTVVLLRPWVSLHKAGLRAQQSLTKKQAFTYSAVLRARALLRSQKEKSIPVQRLRMV